MILGAMWGIGGIYNIVVSIILSGPQLIGSIQILYPSIWQQDIFLRVFLIFLSVIQLPIAYEVMKGDSWSYFGGLAISAIELAIYADFVSLYYSVPTRFGELRTPLLLASLGVSTAYAVLIWVYFNLPYVREYLWRWF